MDIGKRVKELKRALNVTSKELAEAIDIPVRTIGSYERNEAQPGPKFLNALFEKYPVNINWLITGKGDMFTSPRTELDMSYLAQLKDKLNLSSAELEGLIEILNSDASRDMVLKFIEIKKGNKEALDSLICNLQGLKAIYG